MLKYIELKTGFSGNGPAWIANVSGSRTGKTIYFNGRALQRCGGQGIQGNYLDVETGEEFWVSGLKKNGCDRHWAGSGKVRVEAAAVAAYLSLVGEKCLDGKIFEVTHDIVQTDIERIRQLRNMKSDPWEWDVMSSPDISNVGASTDR